MTKVLVVLAEGFEETEALAPVDILRRSGAEVTLAGLNSTEITSSHGIAVSCDVLLKDVFNNDWNAVVLPGGMPGALNLSNSEEVKKAVLSTFSKGGIVGAICASPAVVLGPLGVLNGKKAACYPGMENYSPNVEFVRNKAVVRDSNVITSPGMGCAIEFGLALAEALFDGKMSAKISEAIIFGGKNE